MRRIILLMILLAFLIQPVSALDIQAPTAPEEAQEYLPSESKTFGQDLLFIVKTALSKLHPSITDACGVCLSLVAVSLLISLGGNITGSVKTVSELIGALAMGALLIQPLNTLINLGIQTVTEISEYGKLLLPVMTAALAAQGGVTASSGLYVGTAFMNTIIASLISKLLVPMLYIFLCLSVANCAVGDKVLKSLRDFVKWAMVWILKILLYIFTGYMGITGVVSGSTDASAVKAAKLAISGSVPVVGSILSDASEAVLVSAGIMKNAAGIYGILAMMAICIGPFLRIGVQYLMLKLTAAVCSVFGTKRSSELISDFSGAMGLILAMTGTVCLLQLISTVCFMKGVG